MTDETTRRYAPYLAWRTFFNLVLQLESGLPTRIDRSFLVGRSGVDQTYLIATLKSFGMIADDGTVLDTLKAIVEDRDQRPVLVAEVLRTSYAEVFALPLNATQAQLDDTFRTVYGLSGATLRKSQTFLLHGAAFAQLKLSPYFKTPRGVGATSSPRKPRRSRSPKSSPSPAVAPETATAPTDPVRGGRSDDPTEDMRHRYFEVLLKKVDTTATDGMDKELLDRIERLIGLDQTARRRTAPRRSPAPGREDGAQPSTNDLDATAAPVAPDQRADD